MHQSWDWLQDPNEWRHWPACPLKRTEDHHLETAIVVEVAKDDEGRTLEFYKDGNLFTKPKHWGSGEMTTVEELIERGWRVD